MAKNIFLILIGLVIFSSSQPIKVIQTDDNHPPTIKIIEPSDKSKYDLNSQVHYRIKVSDQEDGESDYEEIASNEVFLEVKYLPDLSKVAKALIPSADPAGLAAMKKSNCFTCHAFNGKLIAPSFNEITNRYLKNPANVQLLGKRIQDGASGHWGAASMPSHPEINIKDAQEIVNWILDNGKDTNLNYYIGTEGSIMLKTDDANQLTGAFILCATYNDHGVENNLLKSLSSKDVIALYLK